ncbi:MAG: hypothetical protein ACR2ND_09470 [Solirubrobacteraceae bacterium]
MTGRGLFRTALGAAAALSMVQAAPALALTSSMTSPAVAVSPNPTAGSPVSLTETGVAIPAASLTVSAQLGAGATCGQHVIDQTIVSGSYSHTSTFTPSQPGNYLICLALSGSSNGSSQTQLEQFGLSVAPAPPPGSAGAQPGSAGQLGSIPAGICLTPRLLRHTLGYVRRLLSAAHCTLGRIYYPSSRTLRLARRRAHGRTPRLVVVSQTPRPGSVQRAGANVAIRLGIGGRRRAPRARSRHHN